MTNQQHRVGGVDSHKDSIHVTVITELGQPVDDREFPTTTAGYRRAVAWLIEHGPLTAVGIEGTSKLRRRDHRRRHRRWDPRRRGQPDPPGRAA